MSERVFIHYCLKNKEVRKMKTLSITVPDAVFEKFTEIQNSKGFSNQSDTLIYITEEVHKQLKEKDVGK